MTFRTTFTTGTYAGILEKKSYGNNIKSLGNKTIRHYILEALLCGMNMKNCELWKL